MTEPAPAPAPAPAFSPQTWMVLYLRGRTDELAESQLGLLRHFRETTYHTLEGPARRFVDLFVKHFLMLFTQPEFVPGRARQEEFVRLGPTIANLAAISCFRTTDAFLALLGDGPADLAKRLALLSPRNAERPDRAGFLDADPALATEWYAAYASGYASTLIDPTGWGHLRDHFAFDDPRLDLRRRPVSYFASTYVGDGRDRVARAVVNRAFRAADAGLVVRNRPSPRKIAVVSAFYAPSHSVHRITRAYVEALAGYHLTFVKLGERPDLDLAPFDEVVALRNGPDGLVDVGPLLDNAFQAVYYPDVGLSAQSMRLTNLRLAPVQVASLGHSVSTFGSAVDYMVSGVEAEPRVDPGRNYSERLVLLPGMGAVHERPTHVPTGRRHAGPEVVVACPWNAQKVNHPLVLALAEMARRARRPVRFRLLAGASLNRRNDFLPFVERLRGLLGGVAVDLIGQRVYSEYMAELEQADLCLDAFPFGGCNTVADALNLRRLIVCREGDAWYNRIGPAMLRRAGLPELIAADGPGHVDLVVRLIDDDALRAHLDDRLARADLDATVFDRSEARFFRQAIDHLIAHHDPSDPDRAPIRIPSPAT